MKQPGCSLRLTNKDVYKLYEAHCNIDVRKAFFTNRVVDIWNSPAAVVFSHDVSIFKRRLTEFNFFNRFLRYT